MDRKQMQFVPTDEGQRLTETYVGESYIVKLKFDSEVEFCWLIFSEFRTHVECYIKYKF
jgi:hypothetical protein